MTTLYAAQLAAEHIGRRITITTGQDAATGILADVHHESVTETNIIGEVHIIHGTTTLELLHSRQRVTVPCQSFTEVTLHDTPPA